MQSAAACAVISAWESGQLWTTKASEMGHATERRQLSAAAAPGRAFLHHSRQHFLDSHRLHHVRMGGVDPVAAPRLRQANPAASLGPPPQADAFKSLLPAELRAAADVEHASLEEGLRAIARLPADFHSDRGAIEDQGRQLLALQDAAPAAGCRGAAPAVAAPAGPRSGSGLNPLLLYQNRLMRQKRQQLGRTLAADEMALVRAEAKQTFESMGEEERGAYELLYSQDVGRRRAGGARASETAIAVAAPARPAYASNFNMAVPASAVAPRRFCEAGVLGLGDDLPYFCKLHSGSVQATYITSQSDTLQTKALQI